MSKCGLCPVSTRHRFDVVTTLLTSKQRCINVCLLRVVFIINNALSRHTINSGRERSFLKAVRMKCVKSNRHHLQTYIFQDFKIDKSKHVARHVVNIQITTITFSRYTALDRHPSIRVSVNPSHLQKSKLRKEYSTAVTTITCKVEERT